MEYEPWSIDDLVQSIVTNSGNHRYVSSIYYNHDIGSQDRSALLYAIYDCIYNLDATHDPCVARILFVCAYNLFRYDIDKTNIQRELYSYKHHISTIAEIGQLTFLNDTQTIVTYLASDSFTSFIDELFATTVVNNIPKTHTQSYKTSATSERHLEEPSEKTVNRLFDRAAALQIDILNASKDPIVKQGLLEEFGNSLDLMTALVNMLNIGSIGDIGIQQNVVQEAVVPTIMPTTTPIATPTSSYNRTNTRTFSNNVKKTKTLTQNNGVKHDNVSHKVAKLWPNESLNRHTSSLNTRTSRPKVSHARTFNDGSNLEAQVFLPGLPLSVDNNEETPPNNNLEHLYPIEMLNEVKLQYNTKPILKTPSTYNNQIPTLCNIDDIKSKKYV